MSRRPSLLACVLALVVLVGLAWPRPASAAAKGAELLITLPDAISPAASAVATAPQLKLDTPGTVADDGRSVAFADLLPETAYNVQIALADGTKLCGVDLGWYNAEPAKDDLMPLDDDDRSQISAIVTDVPSFYSRGRILLLRGDHDRAVALVELVRDTPFHASAGEVIWRVELWYFRNQYGGWEKISQQNKVLRRERFNSADVYQQETQKLRWVAELGGIRLKKDSPRLAITLPPAAAGSPSTRPQQPPADAKPTPAPPPS